MHRSDDAVGDLTGERRATRPESTEPQPHIDGPGPGVRMQHPKSAGRRRSWFVRPAARITPTYSARALNVIGRCPIAHRAVPPVAKHARKRPLEIRTTVAIHWRPLLRDQHRGAETDPRGALDGERQVHKRVFPQRGGFENSYPRVAEFLDQCHEFRETRLRRQAARQLQIGHAKPEMITAFGAIDSARGPVGDIDVDFADEDEQALTASA
jgi:hypothetical protein